MFVEVVLGKASNTSELVTAWRAVLAVLAEVGDRWHGATAGASDAGAFVALLGFESEEGARNTLDHAAETVEWAALKHSLEGLEFHECPEVRAFVAADISQAARVEIIHGRMAKAAPMTASFEAAAVAAQGGSSVIAGLWCWSVDGFATSAVYRRSKGGRKDPEGAALAEPSGIERPTFVALERPWSVFAFGTAPAPVASKGGRKR
jgi:hypothetical protein